MRPHSRHPSELPFKVDPRRVNATIGVIAFLLPIALAATALLSEATCFMSSISHFYYTAVGGDILVGALSVVGAVMILFYVYKGSPGAEHPAHSRLNAQLAKLAGVFALGVAFAPTGGIGCRYGATPEEEVSRFFLTGTGVDGTGAITGTANADFWVSLGLWDSPAEVPFLFANAHYLSAAAMFALLAYFSLVVFTRVQTPAARDPAKPDGGLTDTKWWRNALYYGFGGVIVAAMAALGVKMALVTWILDPAAAAVFSARWDAARGTFWCEAAGLMAFGAAWAVKGRLFGLLEDRA